MGQAVNIPVPTPPPTPQQDFGQRIGDAARQIAQNAIAEATAEIRSQLADARAEQAALQSRLDAAQSSPVRADLARQLDATNLKISKLEEALAKLESRQVTTKIAPRITTSTTPAPAFPTPPMRVDPTEIVAVTLGILFVAFPLTLAFSRFLWKRATGAPAPALSQEQARRFDRLEQSVDAIAIEVERISENQRYLTKLLAEPKQQAKIEA